MPNAEGMNPLALSYSIAIVFMNGIMVIDY